MRPFGVSDLGGAEDRLRNALGLEGKVPVDLPDHSNILPVVIVGDTTRPGMCRSRDRRFIFGNSFTAIPSGTLCAIRASENIVLERIVLSLGGAGTGGLVQHCFVAPGGTALGAYSTPNNPFVDFGRGERAPVQVTTAASALPVVQGVTELLAQTSISLEMGLYLQEGTQFAWRPVMLSTGTFSVWGIGRTV